MTVEVSVFYHGNGGTGKVWAYAAMEDQQSVFVFFGKYGRVNQFRDVGDSPILNFKHRKREAVERGFKKKKEGYKENVRNLFLRRKDGAEVDTSAILSVLSELLFDDDGQIVSVNPGFIESRGMDWGLGDPPAVPSTPNEKKLLKVKTRPSSNSVWAF